MRPLHTRLHARRLHQSAHQTPHQVLLHKSFTTDFHTRLHTRLQARGYHGYFTTSLHAPNIHAGFHTQRSRRHGTADIHGSKCSHQHIRTSRVHIIRSHQTFAAHLAPYFHTLLSHQALTPHLTPERTQNVCTRPAPRNRTFRSSRNLKMQFSRQTFLP